jgi:hypothetical protein
LRLCAPKYTAINFDEEATKFLRPEAEADFLHPQQQVEESIYTDDPVRVYLREMGAVPLLTREGEVDLARRMERGKLRMQKAISRSALVQLAVLELAEAISKRIRTIWIITSISAAKSKRALLRTPSARTNPRCSATSSLRTRRLQLAGKAGSRPRPSQQEGAQEMQ